MKLQPVILDSNKKALAQISPDFLFHLKAAANSVGDIFLEQNYSKNKELLETITDKKIREQFLFNAGPFDKTNHNKPFIKGHKKPVGAGFYPDDLTKKEWDNYITTHPKERAQLESPYTIIKRSGEKLIAIPYKEAYKDHLQKAAEHLIKASTYTTNNSLKQFLKARAEALVTDNYYASELLWMDLNGEIEITIGPYEVYEDTLNSYKTAYETFIGLVDEKATEEVAYLKAQAPLLEEHLPLAEKHQNKNRGKDSPIKIVEEIYATGDCNAGIHFTAYNLPNDEKVRETKGSKKVLIKNVAKAKYEYCWKPILKELFSAEEAQKTGGFDAYFLHVLLHEISHGLGPGSISVNGEQKTDNREQKTENRTQKTEHRTQKTEHRTQKTENREQATEHRTQHPEHSTPNTAPRTQILMTVNSALKETYPTIEEAKADIMGVYNGFILAEKKVISQGQAQEILYSFIAGTIRSIRFGIHEAHGGANSIALNYLLSQEAVAWQEGKLYIHEKLARQSLEELLTIILTIQANGDYTAAKKLIKTYRPHREETKKALQKIKHVPIDIKPGGLEQ